MSLEPTDSMGHHEPMDSAPRFQNYDQVVLLDSVAEHGLAPGAFGSIVEIYDSPPGYLLDFYDPDTNESAVFGISAFDAARLLRVPTEEEVVRYKDRMANAHDRHHHQA